MAIQYTNSKGVAYYLHQGVTKTGKPRYYFSPASEGAMEGALPAGYEIYEAPGNSQVFLRREKEKFIRDEERDLVVARMEKLAEIKLFKIDVKGMEITVWVDQNMPQLQRDDFSTAFGRRPDLEFFRKIASYSPEMRFSLTDEKRRLFSVERFCYRGSVDDWITIGRSAKLETQLDTFLVHLGKESFFELY